MTAFEMFLSLKDRSFFRIGGLGKPNVICQKMSNEAYRTIEIALPVIHEATSNIAKDMDDALDFIQKVVHAENVSQ